MSIVKKTTFVLYHIFRKMRRKCDKIVGGSVAEWLKAHDSKSCGLKSLGGSNPLASAKKVLEHLFFVCACGFWCIIEL